MRFLEKKEDTEMGFTGTKWLRSADARTVRRMVVLFLITGMLCIAWVRQAYAAVSTATVQGTVYLANGEPGSGMLHISWPAFTTANGQAVVADSLDVTIGQDGFLSVNLAPNLGALPAGLYYTAVFYMSDGSVSTQYWVVPAAAQAALAQVQAQVMPAAQAVQAVNKAYVDQAIAQMSESMLTGTGGTLTGPLYLSGDPTQPLQAADKHYVDLAVGQVGSSSVNPASPGQIAYYGVDGKSISGMSAVPVIAGGTGSTTSGGALQNLGGISATAASSQTMAGPLNLSGPYDSSSTNLNQAASARNVQDVAPRSVKEFGAKGDGKFSDFKMDAGSNIVQLVDVYDQALTFSSSDVGKLILLPTVDADHKVLYTTITGVADSTHATVSATASYSIDGTGTWINQVLWGTDDLAAIGSALTAVNNLPSGAGATREGGGSLIFPCGYYVTSGQVSISATLNVQGSNPGCAVIVDMGTTAHDAAVEVGPRPTNGSTWLRGGFYMNASYNNHPEIGQCSGSGCSPEQPGGGVSGHLSDLSIYPSKFASWGLSVLFTYNYKADYIELTGGTSGCFYQLGGVEETYSHIRCEQQGRTFGLGYPVNGVYLDGPAPGQGIDPARFQSLWVSQATGTAFTTNLVGQATLADTQISSNHQSINLRAGSGGIITIGGLFEGGATGQIADTIASSGNIFYGTGFTGTGGVTVSGDNNVFNATGFSGGQTLTITGRNNTFENATMGSDLTINDSSRSTRYIGSYDANTGVVYNRPASEETIQTGDDASGFEAIVKVSGIWKASTTAENVTNTVFTAGQAWKAILMCNWYDYGMITAIPPLVEITDTANTVTAGGRTYTFSISSSGHFQVVADGSDNWQRFSGSILFIPRAAAAGSGGSGSVRWAGTVQAPSMQINTGSTLTGNQGNGSLVQHSTGGITADHLAKFDANGNVVDAGAVYPGGNATGTPTASAGTVADNSTNLGGEITGLSGTSSVTITFAGNGWTTSAFCVGTTNSTAALATNSAQSNTAVMFSFSGPLTGSLYYHCIGR